MKAGRHSPAKAVRWNERQRFKGLVLSGFDSLRRHEYQSISLTMNYKEQMQDYLERHPDSTPEQAYEAGYLQAVDNWCKKER